MKEFKNSEKSFKFNIKDLTGGRKQLYQIFKDPVGVRTYNRDYGWKAEAKDCNNTAKYPLFRMFIELFLDDSEKLLPGIMYNLTDEKQNDYRVWIGDGGSRACSMAIILTVLNNLKIANDKIDEDSKNELSVLPIWKYGFSMPSEYSDSIINFLISYRSEETNFKTFESNIISEIMDSLENIDEDVLLTNDVYKNYMYFCKKLFKEPELAETMSKNLDKVSVALDPIPEGFSYEKELSYFRNINSLGNGMATFERILGMLNNNVRQSVNNLRYIDRQKLSDKLMKTIFLKETGTASYAASKFKKWEENLQKKIDDKSITDSERNNLEKIIMRYTYIIEKIYSNKNLAAVKQGAFSETMLAGLLKAFEKFSDEEMDESMEFIIPYLVQSKYCSLILNSKNATYTTPFGKYLRDSADSVNNVSDLKTVLLNWKYGDKTQFEIFRNRENLWRNYSDLRQKFRIKDTYDYIYKFTHNVTEYDKAEDNKKFSGNLPIGGYETDGTERKITYEQAVSESERILSEFDAKLYGILTSN